MSIPRHTSLKSALLALLSVACVQDPPGGSQIGALREPDPEPQPPTDYKAIDMRAAVEEALALGGLTTLSAAWNGHMSALSSGTSACPAVWLGGLPDDLDLNIDFDFDADSPGMSWLANCATDPGNIAFEGFSHWETAIDPSGASASRTLFSDAAVLGGDGTVLFDFDGEASDSMDFATGEYSSLINGDITGSYVGLGSGLRTGGDFEAAWGPSGLRMFGTVTAFDGFGPPDTRDASAPELASIPTWSAGMPRFTSVRFDLTFTEECGEEPVGFLGIRGNEGFWFDIYFMPIYALEDGTFQSKAFPYEQIDNITCDGIGTLFARNIDLKGEDEADSAWSREIQPDFDAAISSMSTPTVADYIYTLRQIVE